MSLTRRTTLKALLSSGFVACASASPMSAPAPTPATTTRVEAAFEAFLDTVVPADELSPAASALGIGKAILGAAEGKPYARLIKQGSAWLDAQAGVRFGRSFAGLAEGERTEILRTAENAPRKSLENVFFRALRDDVMSRYYAIPAAWPSLRYAGPPQPIGFPGFAQPPRR